ncbi:MAG: hypothetical protein NWE93_11325 [Candidatus Bathyarchaeota archaeon]|nr:hypothetical protein [Candidatus Bathyarchaeota archaeon]
MKQTFRLPPEYTQVKEHLSKLGTWHKTTSRFNVFQICDAIHQYTAAYGDGGDLYSALEELRDYPSVKDWMQAQGQRSGYTYDYDAVEATIKDSALQTLEKDAEYLGIKLLRRNQVAITRAELEYFKHCERQLKNYIRHCNGWTPSLS